MKGISGMLLLLMITASVEANTSANDTTPGTQDSGLNGDLASSVGQTEPNTLACVPFCFPDFNGKREIHVAGLTSAAEKMQDIKVPKRFQPEPRRSIVEKSDSTSLTIPRLFDRKKKALKLHQQMQANQIDRKSIATYKRGVSNKSQLTARLQWGPQKHHKRLVIMSEINEKPFLVQKSCDWDVMIMNSQCFRTLSWHKTLSIRKCSLKAVLLFLPWEDFKTYAVTNLKFASDKITLGSFGSCAV